jgi:hypothetical protein
MILPNHLFLRLKSLGGLLNFPRSFNGAILSPDHPSQTRIGQPQAINYLFKILWISTFSAILVSENEPNLKFSSLPKNIAIIFPFPLFTAAWLATSFRVLRPKISDNEANFKSHSKIFARNTYVNYSKCLKMKTNPIFACFFPLFPKSPTLPNHEIRSPERGDLRRWHFVGKMVGK